MMFIYLSSEQLSAIIGVRQGEQLAISRSQNVGQDFIVLDFFVGGISCVTSRDRKLFTLAYSDNGGQLLT
jgi:hypothetical protein